MLLKGAVKGGAEKQKSTLEASVSSDLLASSRVISFLFTWPLGV